MDEQKPLENKQGEPGKKTEKSEYSFMQETIKDENSRGKKCRKDLLRMAGLGVVFGVCACISFSALKPWLDKKNTVSGMRKVPGRVYGYILY